MPKSAETAHMLCQRDKWRKAWDQQECNEALQECRWPQGPSNPPIHWINNRIIIKIRGMEGYITTPTPPVALSEPAHHKEAQIDRALMAVTWRKGLAILTSMTTVSVSAISTVTRSTEVEGMRVELLRFELSLARERSYIYLTEK